MAAPELAPWINSAGEDGDRNSMQQFDGTGAQTSFDFNFAGGYIYATNVKAYLYDLASGLTSEVTPVVLTGPNTIFVSPAPAAVNVDRTAGQVLVVYRDTQKTVPLVDYTTGAVMNEENLDMSNRQAVFVAAEMVDRFDSINASSADAIERSFEALNKAEDALDASAIAVSDSAAAVTTANAASTVANTALDIAEDAVAAATGLNVDMNLFLNGDADRGISGRAGSVAVPGNPFYRISFVNETLGTGGTVRFDRYNKATGAFVDSVFALDYGGNINTYGKTMYGVAYPANNDHAANKVYVDDREAAVRTDFAAADSLLLSKSGGTMTGMILLPSTTPSLANHATRKAYVDDLAGGVSQVLGNKAGILGATTTQVTCTRAIAINAAGERHQIPGGSFTLNLSTASAALGRDQAGNFVGQFVYIYFIWGSGPGTSVIGSASATAPTLPSGYTHYAFSHPVRVGGTANTMVAYWMNDRSVWYSSTAVAQIMTGGNVAATGSTASANFDVYVPAIATKWYSAITMANNGTGSGIYYIEFNFVVGGFSVNGTSWRGQTGVSQPFNNTWRQTLPYVTPGNPTLSITTYTGGTTNSVFWYVDGYDF